MNSQPTQGPGYPPSNPPNKRQSYPGTNLQTSTYPLTSTTHTLPPLSAPPHAQVLNEQYGASTNPQSQAPYIPTTSAPYSQASAVPPYAPTANNYINNYISNGQSFAYASTQTPQSYQSHHQRQSSSAPATQPYNPPSRNGLQEIQPMPPRPDGYFGGTGPTTLSALTSAYRPGQDSQQLTHVVGAQGRRGILPNDPGRPPAIVEGNRKSVVQQPAKDSDGKYPCPHCNKIYLHAKHLKRHLLRHTGDRPYPCGLCGDNFARSDILKRHFQKCSDRRGNPTGESHLAASRASKAIKRGESIDAAGRMGQVPHQMVNGHITSQSIEQRPLPRRDSSMPNGASLSNHLSRTGLAANQPSSNGISTPQNGMNHNASNFDTSSMSYSNGQVTPESLNTSGAATPSFPYTQDMHSNPFPTPSSAFTSANGHGVDLSSVSRPPPTHSYTAPALPMVHNDEDNLSAMLRSEDFGPSSFVNGTTGHADHQQVKTEQNAYFDYPSHH